MRSRAVATIISALLVVLASLGLVACGTDSTSVPSDTEGPGQSTDGPSVPIEEDYGDEDSYKSDVATITSELNSAFYSLDGLLAKADLDSDEWVSQVLLVTSDMIALCEAAARIVPPDSMTDIHITYLEAIMHYNDAIALLITGLDETSNDLMNQAASEMWLTSEVLIDITGTIT